MDRWRGSWSVCVFVIVFVCLVGGLVFVRGASGFNGPVGSGVGVKIYRRKSHNAR